MGRRVDNDLIADLCMNIGAPCLIFSSLISSGVSVSALAELAGVVLTAYVLFFLIGWLVLRVSRLSTASYLAPLVFPNAGNLGMPVCLYAFGEEGLLYAIVFFSLSATLQFTVGHWLWTGDSRIGTLARTPLIYGVVAAMVVIFTGWSVPSWLLRTTESLGGFTIPLMQFTLGVSLATLKISGLGRSTFLSVVRLAMGFGVGAGLAWAFGLEGIVRGVVVIECAMPAAVINYMFAQKYNRTPEEVASVVVISTTISLVTLPLILAWLL